VARAGFVELCLQPRLEGVEKDIERARTLIDMALEMGHAAVGVLAPPAHVRSLKQLSDERVAVGVIIDVNSVPQLRDELSRTRGAEIVVVRGKNEKLTRVALESRRADVVLSPYATDRLNHIHAKIARDNRIAIALSLRECIMQRGGARSRVLAGYRECVKLWRKLSFPLVLTAEPTDVLSLRCKKEVEAISGLFGLEGREFECVLREGMEVMRRARSELPEGIEVLD